MLLKIINQMYFFFLNLSFFSLHGQAMLSFSMEKVIKGLRCTKLKVWIYCQLLRFRGYIVQLRGFFAFWPKYFYRINYHEEIVKISHPTP